MTFLEAAHPSVQKALPCLTKGVGKECESGQVATTLILLQKEDVSAMLHSIVAVCLVGLGLSIKALPPAGEDPAAREDQPSRADC